MLPVYLPALVSLDLNPDNRRGGIQIFEGEERSPNKIYR